MNCDITFHCKTVKAEAFMRGRKPIFGLFEDVTYGDGPSFDIDAIKTLEDAQEIATAINDALTRIFERRDAERHGREQVAA